MSSLRQKRPQLTTDDKEAEPVPKVGLSLDGISDASDTVVVPKRSSQRIPVVLSNANDFYLMHGAPFGTEDVRAKGLGIHNLHYSDAYWDEVELSESPIMAGSDRGGPLHVLIKAGQPRADTGCASNRDVMYVYGVAVGAANLFLYPLQSLIIHGNYPPEAVETWSTMFPDLPNRLIAGSYVGKWVESFPMLTEGAVDYATRTWTEFAKRHQASIDELPFDAFHTWAATYFMRVDHDVKVFDKTLGDISLPDWIAAKSAAAKPPNN
jgi:hypothetical protein